MLVELFIHRGHIDIDVRMILLNARNALGRGDQVNQADVMAAAA